MIKIQSRTEMEYILFCDICLLSSFVVALIDISPLFKICYIPDCFEVTRKRKKGLQQHVIVLP